MKKYIDADKMISETELMRKVADGITIDGIIEHLRETPAADVAEIVRCKDCKHWHGGDCFRIELTKPSDFCSYGERTDEE